jgi:hypothetical protein
MSLKNYLSKDLSELEQNNYKQIRLMKSVYDESYDKANEFINESFVNGEDDEDDQEGFDEDDEEDDQEGFKEGIKARKKPKGKKPKGNKPKGNKPKTSKAVDKIKKEIKKTPSFFEENGHKLTTFLLGKEIDYPMMNKAYYIILIGCFSVYMAMNTYAQLFGLPEELIPVVNTTSGGENAKEGLSMLDDFISKIETVRNEFKNYFSTPGKKGVFYVSLLAIMIFICEFLFKKISKFIDIIINFKQFQYVKWLYKSDESYLFTIFSFVFVGLSCFIIIKNNFVGPALTLLFFVLLFLVLLLSYMPFVNICVFITICILFIFTMFPKIYGWSEVIDHIFKGETVSAGFMKIAFNSIHRLIVIASLFAAIYYASTAFSTSLKISSITLFSLLILLLITVGYKDMKPLFDQMIKVVPNTENLETKDPNKSPAI